MIYFPVTTVTDCFDNPDEIVKFANTLKYYKSKTGNFPNIRTKSLHEINKKIFDRFIASVLSLYYDFRHHDVQWRGAHVCFHKMKPYSKNILDVRNKGWIHKDDCALAGLVYLNKKSRLDSGTSFYKPVMPIKNKDAINQKRNLYKKNIFNKKIYEKIYKNHNSKFIKIQTVKNVYNNLIVYGGNIWHAFDNMVVEDSKERLNLVFFIQELIIDNTPLIKYKKYRI